MSAPFVLDERIAGTSLPLLTSALSDVRLMNDRRFPWILLVPRRAGISEIFELTSAEQSALCGETMRAARALTALTGAHKINVGALGNIVPQLHIHIVARFRDDAAWPGPVWGSGAAMPYPPEEAEAWCSRFENLWRAERGEFSSETPISGAAKRP